MDSQPKRQKIRCPECLAPIWLRSAIELWEPVMCPECHTALEVVSVQPLALDYIATEDDEADWDDDE